jgi:hypothetical protein
MQNLKLFKYSIALGIFFPSFVFAAQVSDLKSLVSYLISLLNTIIPFLLAIAFIGFIFGVIRYMYSVNSKNLAEARNFIIYSVIALTVMLSVWGLALLLKNTFFQNSELPFNTATTTEGGNTSLNSTSAGGDTSLNSTTYSYDLNGNRTYQVRTRTIETSCGNAGNQNVFDTLKRFFFGGC